MCPPTAQATLEWFFGTLRAQRLTPLTHDGSKPLQRLSYPPECLANHRAQREGYDRCQKAHYVLEAHAEALGLPQRGLLRSLDIAPGVHFTLYRSRREDGLALESVAASSAGGLCNGLTRACRLANPPSVAHAEAAWRVQSTHYEREVRRRGLPLRTVTE